MLVSAGRGRSVNVIDLASGVEMQVSAEVEPVGLHPSGGGVLAWSPDGLALLFIGSDGEVWEQPVDGSQPRQITRLGRALSSLSVSPTGERVAVVDDLKTVLTVDRSTGSAVIVAERDDFAIDVTWLDPDTVVWHSWNVPDMPWDHSRLLTAPALGGTVTVLVDESGTSVAQPTPSGDGRLAFLSDRTGHLNLHLWDRGEIRALVSEPFEHGGPTWGPGARTIAWSPDRNQIAFTRNERGFGRVVTVDVASGECTDRGRAVHRSLSWAGSTVTALRSGGVTPTQLVAYATTDWSRRTLARGPVLGFESLVEPDLICWSAPDGLSIEGRRYRADGDGPQPTVVWIHGGPTDQWDVSFMPRVGFVRDRGWTVLVPDPRGSTGFGRTHTQALRHQWGAADVDDVVTGIHHGIADGWIDPQRVVVMGGSSGGYLALGVLARLGAEPSSNVQARGGVVAYPVVDPATLFDESWRFEQHYGLSLIGDPVVDADRYLDRSALRWAQTITAPLLILHGDSDVVVPISQSQALVAALPAGQAELVTYPGEGHGWKQPSTQLDELARIETFLEACRTCP
jgi:dipeptidyl aminopeptidase/acylaminoacyl peptidase